jgi:hypothetical protein
VGVADVGVADVRVVPVSTMSGVPAMTVVADVGEAADRHRGEASGT